MNILTRYRDSYAGFNVKTFKHVFYMWLTAFASMYLISIIGISDFDAKKISIGCAIATVIVLVVSNTINFVWPKNTTD